MGAEQLAQKFWDALEEQTGPLKEVVGEGVKISAVIRVHEAFSCAPEWLSIQWVPSEEWGRLTGRCEKALRTLHPEFGLLERDDKGHQGLFRSPLSRNAYWEAHLRKDEFVTLTIRRFRPDNRGHRLPVQFLLTIEQLTDLLSGLLREDPSAKGER